MSKFGALVASVDQPFRQELISPITGEVLRDKKGNPAYIEVHCADSKDGRAFDKDQRAAQIRQARAGETDPPDQLEANIAKCAALTRSWHLVDPFSGEPINVPCTRENALELYSDPGASWLFVQAWMAALRTANFMQRPSKGLSPMRDTSSGTAAA